MSRLVCLAFILVVAAAGCLEPKNGAVEAPALPVVSADWPQLALPFGPNHLHNRSEQHVGLSTPNFQTLGWSPLTRQGEGNTMAAAGCGDGASGDGTRRLAVMTATWPDSWGLVVADVTDPAKPEKVGEVVTRDAWFRDAGITTDGRWAVAASFPEAPAAPNLPVVVPSGLALGTGPECSSADDFVPPALMTQTGGVALIDLADPSNPQIVDFEPDPNSGPHSVYATTIDGTHYVLSTINDFPHSLSRFYFYTIEDGMLEPFGVISAQFSPDPASTPTSNLHVDAWIQKHPKTGQVLAYLANWDGGLVIADLVAPGRVERVTTWSNYDPTKGSEMTGQSHSVAVTDELWDGKHYTFVGQEIIARPANRPTGEVIMLDTTDPAEPTPVARWTLPTDPGKWDTTHMWCCLFSTHYIELVDHTLFVALYHGGIWAVDARPEAGPELPSLGVYVPTPPKPGFASPHGLAPMVMEVIALDNGALVTFDEGGGIYTFEFDPQTPVPAPKPWTADSWIK